MSTEPVTIPFPYDEIPPLETLALNTQQATLAIGYDKWLNGTYIKGESGNKLEINSDGQGHVVMRGKADSSNSIESNLIADEVWVGVSVDTLDYATIAIQVHSDVEGVLEIMFSPDEVEWRAGETAKIIAGGDKFFTPTIQNRYVRLTYTNGSTNTSSFGIHTMLRKQPIKWSSHNIDDPIKDQDDAELVKAVLTGKSPSGIYDNVKINPEGALSTTNFLFEVARGNVNGVSFVHKYGRNSVIDTASGFEAIWNGGGDYTGFNCVVAETLETFSSSVDDAGTLLSSGNATDGSITTLIDTGATFVSDGVVAGDILINDTQLDHAYITAVTETQLTFLRMKNSSLNVLSDVYRVATQASTGSAVVAISKMLDGDYDNETSEYIILNGTTPVDTVGTYIRHSRGRCYLGTNIGGITTRQKTTTANVTMVLPAGYNATMISAYTIPRGKHAFIYKWFTSLAVKRDGFSIVRLMTKEVNGNFEVAEELALSSTGNSYIPRSYDVPKDSIMEMTDIKIMADASVNGMGVAAGFDLVLVDN